MSEYCGDVVSFDVCFFSSRVVAGKMAERSDAGAEATVFLLSIL